MKQAWPLVKLGEVLQQVSRQELVDPLREYTTLGVRWYAQGLFAKDKLMGHQIAAPKIYRVEEGDFVYNRLFAWKGSFAVADNTVSNCYVSNEFPCFRSIEGMLDVRYLHTYFRQEPSWTAALGLSSGATPTSRNRLKEAAFLSLNVPLPPLEVQRSIVARFDQIQQQLQTVTKLREAIDKDIASLLAVRFRESLKQAPLLPMREIAPLVRRNVQLETNQQYKELGARSFGKGLFVKSDFDADAATWEKPVWIKTGDIVFSNIKAWEGAIGVAKPEHDGFIASHRYLTAVAKPELALPEYLLYYLLSETGLTAVNEASPGTADRNRTTKQSALEAIHVPVPSLAIQRQFVKLKQALEHAAEVRTKQMVNVEAMLPALCNQVLSQQ
jgi:type I restriction enzyme S subunit